jgi:hypothetical protein
MAPKIKNFVDLHSAIYGLDATGTDGFEGFVRDVLSEVTGQRFRIAKSGPQGGVDVLSDPNETSLKIGVEGKRYKPETKLSLDALKSKLHDAIDTYTDLDLWILAATKAIASNDAQGLVRIGEKYGISVVIFDWDESESRLPQLAVLCACAPIAIQSHFPNAAKIAADISTIQTHPAFFVDRAKLVALLTSPDIGYAQAKAAVRDRIVEQTRTINKSRLAFDCPLNIGEANVHRVKRTDVFERFEGWWTSTPHQPAVVLGEEGIGKTWAAVSWVLEQSAQDADFPLTLIIAARDVDTSDGLELLAKSLRKATDIRDAEFWGKRLKRWFSPTSLRPRLLIVLDGLNQNWSFTKWDRLVLSLSVDPGEGAASVLMTCRPEHWRSGLKRMEPSIRPPPFELSVGPFTDSEIDEALSAHELQRSDFSNALLTLMRMPRLCRVAIERRCEMGGSGDITAERLIYEDWKYRSRSASSAYTHEDFVEFIADVGRRLLASQATNDITSRRNLLEDLGRDSGQSGSDLIGVVSEIVDGGWFEATEKPNQFRVRLDRLPHVLGLALEHEVKRIGVRDQIDNAIQVRLEPYSDADIATAILRSATVIAFSDPQAGEIVRRALVDSWLSSRNFVSADFDEFWRLIALDPVAVLDVVEEQWFGLKPSGRQVEVIGKGFGNAWRWRGVAKAVEERLTQWFSRYWANPLLGEFSGNPANARHSQEAALRAEQWLAKEEAANLGFKIQLVDGQRDAIAARYAAALMSWLPRAPLIQPLVAWALTQAILGVMRQRSLMAWLLRSNPLDGEATEPAVLEAAQRFLRLRNPTADQAAAALLRALATPAAQAVLDRRFKDKERWLELRSSVQVDEVGVCHWDPREELTLPRGKAAPLHAARYLVPFASDPSVELSDAGRLELRSLANNVSDSRLLSWMTNGSGDDAAGRLPLARWAPDLLAALERRTLDVASKWFFDAKESLAAEGQRGPMREAPTWLRLKIDDLAHEVLVHDDKALRRWRDLANRLPVNSESAIDTRFLLEILDKTAAAAPLSILHRAWPMQTLKRNRLLLSSPRSADIPALGALLSPSKPDDVIVTALTYLTVVDRSNIPLGWPVLIALLDHPTADVRAQVMYLGWLLEDADLADALEISGWTHLGRTDREAFLGSLLLCRSPKLLNGELLIDRIRAEAVGHALELWPDSAILLDRFAEYVGGELMLAFENRSRGLPRAQFSVSGWDALARHRPVLFRDWFKSTTSESRSVSTLAFIDAFPVIDAVKALAIIDPRAAADFALRAITEEASGAVHVESVRLLAMELPGDQADDCRDAVLDLADDDDKLFAVARYAQKNGRVDWLFNRIARDLSAPNAGLIARGMTLAGFLSTSPRTDAFWGEYLPKPPATGWLATVYYAAKASFERDRAMQHWYEAFKSAARDDDAFGCHMLMVEAADERLLLSGCLPTDIELAEWPLRRRAHWITMAKQIRDSMKRRVETRKKTFLWTEPPGDRSTHRLR